MSNPSLNEQREKILVVEDDRNVADALRIIMEDNGYETVLAMNAHQGLEQSRLRRFDLVITDVQLPDMSGLDVLTTLRKEAPARPVIIITAHSSVEIITEAKTRGAFHVLPKPFQPSEILDLARRAIAQ